MGNKFNDFNIFKNRLGFREDFDWETRFDLKTKIGTYTISTVDLGIDHSFGLGKPLYYETMIFNGNEKNVFEDYQVRYSTEDEAKEGHEFAIELVKKYIQEKK